MMKLVVNYCPNVCNFPVRNYQLDKRGKKFLELEIIVNEITDSLQT